MTISCPFKQRDQHIRKKQTFTQPGKSLLQTALLHRASSIQRLKQAGLGVLFGWLFSCWVAWTLSRTPVLWSNHQWQDPLFLQRKTPEQYSLFTSEGPPDNQPLLVHQNMLLSSRTLVWEPIVYVIFYLNLSELTSVITPRRLIIPFLKNPCRRCLWL